MAPRFLAHVTDNGTRVIGFLLERVDILGLRDETAIIVTSDHGFYLGEHGNIGKSLIRGERHQSLPLYPELEPEQRDYVIASIRHFFGA